MKRRDVLQLGGMAVIAGAFAPFAALEETWAQQAVAGGHTPCCIFMRMRRVTRIWRS